MGAAMNYSRKEWLQIIAAGVFAAIALYLFVFLAFLLDGKP